MTPTFYQFWFHSTETEARCSVLVDLTAVSSIMRVGLFEVALLIGDDWQHMNTRLGSEEDEDRYAHLVECWKQAREKLHNPLYVGNVSYVPAKDV